MADPRSPDRGEAGHRAMGNQHHGPPEPLQARPRRSPHEKAGLYCSRRNLIAGTRSLEQRLPFVTISADGPVYTAEELETRDASHFG